jgi:hypothetical protein
VLLERSLAIWKGRNELRCPNSHPQGTYFASPSTSKPLFFSTQTTSAKDRPLLILASSSGLHSKKDFFHIHFREVNARWMVLRQEGKCLLGACPSHAKLSLVLRCFFYHSILASSSSQSSYLRSKVGLHIFNEECHASFIARLRHLLIFRGLC